MTGSASSKPRGKKAIDSEHLGPAASLPLTLDVPTAPSPATLTENPEDWCFSARRVDVWGAWGEMGAQAHHHS